MPVCAHIISIAALAIASYINWRIEDKGATTVWVNRELNRSADYLTRDRIISALFTLDVLWLVLRVIVHQTQ